MPYRGIFPAVIVSLSILVAPSFAQIVIESDLNEVLARRSAHELIPVAIILKPQVHFDDIYPQVKNLPKFERRQRVIDELRNLAESAQGALLGDLFDLERNECASKIRPLWISNVVAAQVQAGEIKPLAARHPEIARIHYDPPRDPAEILDYRAADGLTGTDDIAWGVTDINAPLVWSLGYWGQDVLIANLDMGVDYTHPDLADHIWVNPGEDINGNGIVDSLDWNGIDDDGNGYIDDLRGWAFLLQTPEVMDNDGHGTATAGIVIGDGTGGTATGVAPQATMMVLKNLGSESDYWEAQQYAILMEADILTSSMSYKWWYHPRPDYATMRQNTDMELAAGLIHTNSIGNQGNPQGQAANPIPFNIATPGNCPPPWLHPDQTLVGGLSAVLGVGAFNSGHVLQSTSGTGPASWFLEDIYFLDPNYNHPWDPHYDDYPYQQGDSLGLLKPDLAAPSLVPTTALGGGYVTFSGTSAATPHVGGALCLLLSADSTATPEMLAQAVMTSAIDMGEPGKDNEWGCGRLDAFGALVEILVPISATLTGTVTDANTGQPVEVAAVALPQIGMESLTDSSGCYVIPGIPEGLYDVRFTAAGYDTLWIYGISFSIGEVETLSVSLGGPQILVSTATIVASLPPFFCQQSPLAIFNTGSSNLTIEFDKAGDWTPFEVYSGIQAQIATADTQLYGVEVADGYVWISGGNSGAEPNRLYRFTFDGELHEILDQPPSLSSSGWRDLAWDGQLLYGSSDDYIVGVDLTGNVQDSIPGPLDVHTALAYDPDSDHFFICDNTSNILEINRAGTILSTVGHTLHVSGLAWHPDDEEGMSLYIFSRDGSPAYLRVSKVNPDVGDVVYLTDLIAAPGEMAGGAAISGDIDPDRWSFVAMIQGYSDRVQYVSLNAYAPWLSVEPSSATILPDTSMVAMVTFDAGQVNAYGDYEINLVIEHNAPQDEVIIPVILTVEPCAVETPLSTGVPTDFAVLPAYPNPFNAQTVIPLELPQRSHVKIELFNVTGRKIGTIHEGVHGAGWPRVHYNASYLASGVYFYRITADGLERGGKFIDVGKLILLK